MIDLVVFGKAAAKRAAELVKPGMPHEEISVSETDKCLERFDSLRNGICSPITARNIKEMIDNGYKVTIISTDDGSNANAILQLYLISVNNRLEDGKWRN